MTDKIEEEHHTILFPIQIRQTQNGQLTEQMENDVLQGKDPFTKSSADT